MLIKTENNTFQTVRRDLRDLTLNTASESCTPSVSGSRLNKGRLFHPTVPPFRGHAPAARLGFMPAARRGGGFTELAVLPSGGKWGERWLQTRGAAEPGDQTPWTKALLFTSAHGHSLLRDRIIVGKFPKGCKATP